MANNAREQILANIRRGVNNPELMADRKRQLARFQPASFDPFSLVSRWREELEALTGQVYGPMPSAAAGPQLIELVKQYGSKSVLAWADVDLPIPEASQQLRTAGLTVEALAGRAQGLDRRQTLAQIPVGITGAMAGLADTGSFIVDSGAGRARSASLLPPVHIALLRVADLYPDLPTWMALQGADILADIANLTIITGPSKTADIELNLVLGVHGPGEVHVILLED